jgi:hypothetical protein
MAMVDTPDEVLAFDPVEGLKDGYTVASMEAGINDVS